MVKIFTVFLLILPVLSASGIEIGSVNPAVAIGLQAEQVLAETIQETETSGEGASDLTLFFGRFHPFLVHLPIGFLLFAFLLELTSMFKRFEELKHAVPFALLIGFLSAVMAGITGFLLSTGGGYGADILSAHRGLGTSVIVLSLLAFLLRVTLYEDPFYRRFFRVTLVIMAAAVMVTGHYGGSLTHGTDYLFRYMPESLQSMLGIQLSDEEEQIALIEDLNSAEIYHDIISPIIRTRCESCHNPDRTEGELLLISYQHLMEGGESGPVITANNANQSELYKRLILPASDDDRMPPSGRRQLTHDQIRLIGWWIDLGAPSGTRVSELEVQSDISGILQKLTVQGQSFFARTTVPKADEESIEKARTFGFRISKIAEDLDFLQVGVSQSVDSLTGEDMQLLLPLAQQITWLDLNRIKVSDSDLTGLSDFKNMTRLSLQNTHIGDKTLQKISALENLEYLNVYATQITDDGLEYLKNLKNLRSLYLWQTNVSSEAVADLQDSLPDIYINFGESHGVVADGE